MLCFPHQLRDDQLCCVLADSPMVETYVELCESESIIPCIYELVWSRVVGRVVSSELRAFEICTIRWCVRILCCWLNLRFWAGRKHVYTSWFSYDN